VVLATTDHDMRSDAAALNPVGLQTATPVRQCQQPAELFVQPGQVATGVRGCTRHSSGVRF